MKVVAAMSGGVDSAVAAARMVEAGHDVTGIHLALSRSPRSRTEGSRGCCSLEDVHDARRAADRIGIPFYVWDFSERFADEVIDPFVAEYAAGRTPNPCLRCNERIKFAALLDRALDLGYDAVASGHYARLDGQETGRPVLRRARDRAKDQSYVLGVLTADQLSHCLFPLGELHKSQVRAQAASLGLAVADKPDSTDICFIPDGDTAGWLDSRLGSRPGEIVEEDGTVVGHHDGHHHFTVGQRRGLHLGTPAPDGRPRYVLALEPVSNRVVVGSREGLQVDSLAGVGPVWCTADPGPSWRGQVQVRAHGSPVEARFTRHGDEVRVDLAAPLTGVAPGQAAVFYDDDVVVGSMTIATTRRRASQPVVGS